MSFFLLRNTDGFSTIITQRTQSNLNRQRTIKWHEPFCGAKTSLRKFTINMNYQNNGKANI